LNRNINLHEANIILNAGQRIYATKSCLLFLALQLN